MHAYHQRLHFVLYISDVISYKIPAKKTSYNSSFVRTYIQRHLRTQSCKNACQNPIIHLVTTTSLYNHTYILHSLNKTFYFSFINIQQGKSHLPSPCPNYGNPFQVTHHIVASSSLLRYGIPCLL